MPDCVISDVSEITHEHRDGERGEGAGRGDFDFVIICSKAFPGNKPTTASLIAPVVGPATTIVLIQNGIGIEEEYKTLFPGNTVLTCVVYLPTTQISPGVIRMGGVEVLEIGVYSSPSSPSPTTRRNDFAKAKELQTLVTKAGGTAKVYRHIQIRRWKKLLLNTSLNPICALSRSSDAIFATSSELAEGYLRGVMGEVVDVALAVGINDGLREATLPPKGGTEGSGEQEQEQEQEKEFGKDETGIGAADIEEAMQRIKDRIGTEGVEPSMLADVRNGRRMEVEAVVGNVVRLGMARGAEVGRLVGLYVLVKALDGSFVRDAGRG